MAHHEHELAPELRTLLDTSPDAVLIVNPAGTVVALNRRAEMLFATDAGQLQGKPMEVLLPERFRRSHASARAAYGASPTVRAMSTREGLRGLRADGTEFPVEVSLTPVLDSAEGLVMAVVHDVSARTRLESTAGRTPEMMGALDAISDAVFTTDAHGNVEFLNPAAEALTGQTREAARGRPLSEILPLVHEASGEALMNPVVECLRSGRPAASCEAFLAPRPDQSRRVLDVSAAPARDPTGVISGGVVVARDITQARLIARQLSHQATHDALTGLVNRGEFERRLARALAGAAAEHSQHAVCFLDLDGFKRVNDACGHLAGDDLLKQLSDVMRERMRARDTLARLGGDEFGLLLEHCGLPRAQRIADAIRQAIGAYRFTFGAETYAVGVSIGIVPVRPGVHRPGDVLKAADAACYRAKRSGGHRVQVSTGSHRSAEAPPAAAWSRRLLLALERGLFRLYAQPLRSLGHPGAAAQGFELLLRLDEGDGEPLAANAFLPAAKRAGLMAAIDRWVIRRAAQQLSEWHAAHPGRDLAVAINLADETLVEGEAAALVEELLSHPNMRPEAMCFEISEASVAGHPKESARLLQELRAAGCRTTLEHCGSGMAAFTLLRRLQPDYLKIAGHIVRGLPTDPVHRALATALNEVGHVLGLRTIGAQVDGPGVLECLRRIGVDYAQGFHVGPPEPLETALARLGRHAPGVMA